MLHQIVLEDEITLWWTKDAFFRADNYKFYLDGKAYGEKDKTHFTFAPLKPDTAYHVRIEAYKNDVLVAERDLEIVTKSAKNKIYITDEKYGAVGDKTTLNTTAIQKAFDDCTEKDVVVIPKGDFLTGALNVHSDMEVYLEEGAILRGSKDEKDYLPKIKSRFEGIENMSYRSLINMGELDSNGGYNCKNVVLRGKGCITGGGMNLHASIIDAETERIKDTKEYKQSYQELRHSIRDYSIAWRVRGRLIHACNTDGLILSGLKLEYGPAWTVHPIYSRNVVTYNCHITSIHVNNGDGWDPDSSEDCVIFDTVFDTGDDCIAIKSGKNPEGNIINRPSRNIYVFDCRAISGHSGLGIGSEMSGGVENVFAWDCDFSGVWFGVHIKGTKERGGYVRNVDVRDSKLSCIVAWHVDYNTDGESAKTAPVFENYRFENVEVNGITHGTEPYFAKIKGFDNGDYAIRNVTLKDVTFINVDEEKALDFHNYKDITLQNVKYEIRM